jgi:sigma-E factor negative regulatory protein RseB
MIPFAGLWALAFAVAASAEEPREWLERMNEALTSRNYEGEFVHESGGRMQTMRIVHRVQGGEVRERIASLDGSGRELIRRGAELTCYLPDQRTVLVEKRPSDGPLLGALPSFDADTSGVYEIRGGARERLMRRMTRVIAVHPRDDFRYGYRLWIDEETAMPLKTQLCDARGNVIEQIKFSRLVLPRQIPDSAFQPQVATEGFRWLRAESAPAQQGAPSMLWSALRLPPGFKLTARSTQVLPGASGTVEHLVFTDGLASVSVFVEPRLASDRPDRPMPGPARFGSSSAFSTVVEGERKLTVVGEVPPATAKFFATSVQSELRRERKRGN